MQTDGERSEDECWKRQTLMVREEKTDGKRSESIEDEW